MPACPARLLLIGLPLTIALGTVVAVLLFPTGGWAAAALIAFNVAPTEFGARSGDLHEPGSSRRVRARPQRGERPERAASLPRS